MDRLNWRRQHGSLFVAPRSDTPDPTHEFNDSLRDMMRSVTQMQSTAEQTITTMRSRLHQHCADLCAAAGVDFPGRVDLADDEECWRAAEHAARTLANARRGHVDVPTAQHELSEHVVQRVCEILKVKADGSTHEVVNAIGRAAVELVSSSESAAREQSIAFAALENYSDDVRRVCIQAGIDAPDPTRYLGQDAAYTPSPSQPTWLQKEAIPNLLTVLRTLGGSIPDVSRDSPATAVMRLIREIQASCLRVNSSARVKSEFIETFAVAFGDPSMASEDWSRRLGELHDLVRDAASLLVGKAKSDGMLELAREVLAAARGVVNGDNEVPTTQLCRWEEAILSVFRDSPEFPAFWREVLQTNSSEHPAVQPAGSKAGIEASLKSMQATAVAVARTVDALLRQERASLATYRSVFDSVHQACLTVAAKGLSIPDSPEAIAAFDRAAIENALRELHHAHESVAKLSRQAESAKVERQRLDELVRFSLVRTCTSAANVIGDSLADDLSRDTAATLLDRVEQIVKDLAARYQRLSQSADTDRVRLTNLNESTKVTNKKGKNLLTATQKLCRALGLQYESGEASRHDAGPVHALDEAAALISRCVTACDGDTEGAAGAVGEVRASVLALHRVAELEEELAEATENEQRTSEVVVLVSKRLRELLLTAERVLAVWSPDPESSRAANHAYTTANPRDPRTLLTYSPTDEVPDEVELTTEPTNARLRALHEVLVSLCSCTEASSASLQRTTDYLRTAVDTLTGSQHEAHTAYVTDCVASLARLADDILLHARQREPAAAVPKAPLTLERAHAALWTSPERENRAAEGRGGFGVNSGDHRLQRVVDELRQIWATVVSLAQLKFFCLPDVAPTLAKILSDPQDPSSVAATPESLFPSLDSSADLLPDMERACVRIFRALTAISDGAKRSAILLQRDITQISDTLSQSLAAFVESLDVDAIIADPQDLRRVIAWGVSAARTSLNGGYFSDRPDGEGRGTLVKASEYVSGALERLLDWHARDAKSSRKFPEAVLTVLVQRVLEPGRHCTAHSWSTWCHQKLRDVQAEGDTELKIAEILDYLFENAFPIGANPPHCELAQATQLLAEATAEKDRAQSQLAVIKAKSNQPPAKPMVVHAPLERTSSAPHPRPSGNGSTVESRRRYRLVESSAECRTSPTRVGRNLQRSHYFTSIVQEYAAGLDDELRTRQRLSSPGSARISPLSSPEKTLTLRKQTHVKRAPPARTGSGPGRGAVTVVAVRPYSRK
jgi:hypothetical protein